MMEEGTNNTPHQPRRNTHHVFLPSYHSSSSHTLACNRIIIQFLSPSECLSGLCCITHRQIPQQFTAASSDNPCIHVTAKTSQFCRHLLIPLSPHEIKSSHPLSPTYQFTQRKSLLHIVKTTYASEPTRCADSRHSIPQINKTFAEGVSKI